MSLGVAIKGPEGIVLAADSRVTISAQVGGQVMPIHYDNASKLLTFAAPHDYVGAVTYGIAGVGGRTVHGYLPEFEISLPKARISVEEYAKSLSDFYMKRWPKQGEGQDPGALTFLVGGYDEKVPYGNVFLVTLPHSPNPSPRNPGDMDFGMTWGGQAEIATRLIFGFDGALPDYLRQELELPQERVSELFDGFRKRAEFKLPYKFLPLQDCIDLATFLVRTTITAQSLAVGIRGVGGQIEVAVVTRTKGLQFIQKRSLHGEASSNLRDRPRRLQE